MRIILFTMFLILAAITVVAVLNQDEIRAAAAMIKAVKIVKSSARINDAYLLLGSNKRLNEIIFSRYFPKSMCESLVFSSNGSSLPVLNLNEKFPAYQGEKRAEPYIGDVKEIFLRADRVWIFREIAHPKQMGEKIERALHWIELTTDVKKTLRVGNRFLITLHQFKTGIASDGVLLDLFVNDFGDTEKAAILIQDDTFRPEALRGYFYEHSTEKINEAAQALLKVCGVDDRECRNIVLEKIRALTLKKM